jgi:methylglyoxal synthase
MSAARILAYPATPRPQLRPRAGVPSISQAMAGLEPARGSAILLIAHDHRKGQLVDLAICYRDVLCAHRLISTATTSWMLRDMVGLDVERLDSDLGAGDVDIDRCIAEDRLSAVIFLVDPFTRRDHEPRVETALIACCNHDIPLATNVGTAAAVLNMLSVLDASTSVYGVIPEEK